ncbi:MAG: peptidoglycan DD-metalloendopeptidase family protein [Candidatus Moranbacteria bacterium]|nr:peptidoglycan DD-metalloendopeptidase family protein [Candidatus Moranbacteria bacterium]
MTKRNRSIVIFVLAIILIAFVSRYVPHRNIDGDSSPDGSGQNVSDVVESPAPHSDVSGTEPAAISSPIAQTDPNADGFVPPLVRAGERVTKKPFGIFVAKATSPVRPERFSGYHTGTDFETFPVETDVEVSVSAVCSGKLLSKRIASGYGGVAVQSCIHNGTSVTIVYGHLRLSSIAVSVGGMISAGDPIGTLGKGYSTETDGERGHLHLGIHKGDGSDIRGYVSSKAELTGWIDPCMLVCHS